MSEEIKENIKAYYIGSDVDKVLDYIQQKENIIKEVREYAKEMQVYCIEFGSWGVPSKELLEILDKESKVC